MRVLNPVSVGTIGTFGSVDDATSSGERYKTRCFTGPSGLWRRPTPALCGVLGAVRVGPPKGRPRVATAGSEPLPAGDARGGDLFPVAVATVGYPGHGRRGRPMRSSLETGPTRQ